ncbi:energy-coupling factor transporter transmembrane protein EcfT [Nocardioides sp. C4-1]|uniref:energy-coupling factor transporter transmembrane protein EcfT n=1 Tax=Nocardioides sp. C4-1 TaxID=3151851 RepID=UPI003266F2FC
MSTPVAFYRPGTTVLHRTPAAVKLVALLIVSVTVVVLHGPVPTASGAGLAVVAAVVARLPWRAAARASRSIVVIAVVAAALQWWWYDAATALETLVDLLALSLLALVLTLTTSVVALVDVLTRALRPLRPLGVDPDRVALAIMLAIGALPTMVVLARESRDAASARGLDRSVRAHVTPFVVRVVARAHETGDALAARGIDD